MQLRRRSGPVSEAETLVASVVVPTYMRRRRIEQVVSAVLEDPCAEEVVVVVDGCRDGTLEALQEMARRHPRLRPVFVENRGEGLARQAGAEEAKGDVLVFLDDDVIAGSRLVSGHLRHHAEREGLVVMGYAPTDLVRPRRPGQFATELYAREYEHTCDEWEQHPRLILESLWAGNFSIRRSDALEVGLASPTGPLPYHEDRAFGLRCRDAGLTGCFDRSLRARHLHSRSMEQFVSDARRQGAGALQIHRSHESGPFPFLGEMPFPAAVRTAIHLAARHRILQELLRATVGLAGRLHAYYLESYTAMVLRAAVQRETVVALQQSPGASESRIPSSFSI